MQIDELKKISFENLQRSYSIMAAITELIAIKVSPGKTPELLVLSANDTAEVLRLLQSVRYAVEQQEIINTELLAYHFNSLQNFDLGFKDTETTAEEKIKLLAGMVETAIQFVPAEIKTYLELKRERVYTIINDKK